MSFQDQQYLLQVQEFLESLKRLCAAYDHYWNVEFLPEKISNFCDQFLLAKTEDDRAALINQINIVAETEENDSRHNEF